MATKLNQKFGLSASELVEQAVHLLRKAPLNVLLLYYVGAVPFVLSFLYFWSDMSRSAFAESRCGSGALGLALVFIWMKTWQAIFSSELRKRISGHNDVRWTFSRFMRTALIQGALQSTGFFTLPIALIIALPFGWMYAFYQNIAVVGGHAEGIKDCFNKAVAQARLWQKQNHLFLGIFSMFGFCAFLNIAIAIIQIPGLLKMLLGIETVFTKSGMWSLFNTTFFASAIAVTYLALDPLVKAVYVLRCFYGDSITSGEDLKADLQAIQQRDETTQSSAAIRRTASIVGICLLTFLGSGVAHAETGKAMTVPNATPTVSSPDLNRSIEEVLNRREFTWRLPREKLPTVTVQKKTWLDSFLGSIRDMFVGIAKTLRDWVRTIFEWIAKMFPKRDIPESTKTTSTGSFLTTLQVLIFVLLALVASAIAILFFRIWKQRKRTNDVVVAQSVPAQPDLADENVVADQLPEDGWLKMARELMEQGNLRLALRAFYLASLAHLAQREMISIAKFKSNRDYELEVRRRARALPDLQTAFAQNVGIFDRVWYGMHEVNQEALQNFQGNFERIRSC